MVAEKAVASGASIGDGVRKRAVGQAQSGSDNQPAQPEDNKKLEKKVSPTDLHPWQDLGSLIYLGQ